VTAERKAKLSFTAPYLTNDFGVLVKPGTAVDAASLPGLRIGVREATAASNFVRETLKAKSVTTYLEQGELFAALRAGQIDVVVTDLAIALSEQGLESGSLVTVGRFHSGEAFAAIYPKGTPNGPVFDRILSKLKDDGTDKWLAKKYLWSVWNLDPEVVPYFGP
jgi:polar amino acid transport system substrate-binding protein